jgi:hypothetical protein
MEESFGLIKEVLHQSKAVRKYVDENPVRIAIIDTGVAICSLLQGIKWDNSSNVQDIVKPVGKSFVEVFPDAERFDDPRSFESHWHSPLNPHGTGLMEMIRPWNQHVKFIIAKVSGGESSSPDTVNLEAAKKVCAAPLTLTCESTLTSGERQSDGHQKSKGPTSSA